MPDESTTAPSAADKKKNKKKKKKKGLGAFMEDDKEMKAYTNA